MPETSPLGVKACERIGVDPKNLGVVMLDCIMPAFYKHLLMQPGWAYYSSTLKYVNGIEEESHCTLLYGLCFPAHENSDLIYEAMQGWVKPDRLYFPEVDVFRSNDGVNDYGALVLRPQSKFTSGFAARSTAALHDANQRLGKMPHVRPFPDYNPHVTVGYISAPFIDTALAELRMAVDDQPLVTTDLNLGTPND